MKRAIGIGIGLLLGISGASAQQSSVCQFVSPSPCYLSKYEMTINIQTPLSKNPLGFRPGTILQGIGDTSSAVRTELDSYAQPGYLTLTRRNAPIGIPTKVLAGDDLGGLETWPFDGSTVRGPNARVHAIAAEDITASHWGSEFCLATVPLASTTLSDGLCQQPSGGVTIGSPTGGDKGSGTFNSAGTIYENNVPLDSAAFVPTGTSGHSVPFLDGNNQWSGVQTFDETLTSENDQSGTTYSLASGDCGRTVAFSNGSAVTVTIPQSIVPAVGTLCRIWIRQDGVGQIAVNGSAVTPATLVSAHGFTKTFGQHAEIWLDLTTIGATATAVLMGDGA